MHTAMCAGMSASSNNLIFVVFLDEARPIVADRGPTARRKKNVELLGAVCTRIGGGRPRRFGRNP
jgi:hypothetical protein